MIDDLVKRLYQHHEAMRGPDYYQAATALSKAIAEIERLNSQVDEREGRLKAESELSTLRSRVREVVGPIADQADKYDPDEGDSHEHAWGRLDLTIGDLRAARQLMKEVK